MIFLARFTSKSLSFWYFTIREMAKSPDEQASWTKWRVPPSRRHPNDQRFKRKTYRQENNIAWQCPSDIWKRATRWETTHDFLEDSAVLQSSRRERSWCYRPRKPHKPQPIRSTRGSENIAIITFALPNLRSDRETARERTLLSERFPYVSIVCHTFL